MLTQDISSVCLYGSYNSRPLEIWYLGAYQGHYSMCDYQLIIQLVLVANRRHNCHVVLSLNIVNRRRVVGLAGYRLAYYVCHSLVDYSLTSGISGT